MPFGDEQRSLLAPLTSKTRADTGALRFGRKAVFGNPWRFHLLRFKGTPACAQGVAAEISPTRTPQGKNEMDETVNKTNTKSTGSAKTDTAQTLRAAAETGSAQVKQGIEKMTAATLEANAALKNCCSTALQGAQDYNTKVIEFAQSNSQATLEFMQKLPGMKSPSEFVGLSTEFSRRQLETLTEQAKELAALAEKVTRATTEPLKTGVAKAFSQAA